jgi:hypothetical protein
VSARFGDRDPAGLGDDDVAAWIAELAESRKPGTVQLHLVVLRLLLDFVGLEPGP